MLSYPKNCITLRGFKRRQGSATRALKPQPLPQHLMPRMLFLLRRPFYPSRYRFQLMHMPIQPLHMMMMRPLRFADRLFVADDRDAVLAERAVHVSRAVQRFLGPLGEGIEKQRMYLQM